MDTTHPPMRRRRMLAAAAALASAATGVLVGAAPATAASKAVSVTSDFDGTSPTLELFSTEELICDDCYPDILNGDVPTAFGFLAKGSLDLKYQAPVLTNTAWDDSFLRQGATMPVSNTMVGMPGTVMSKWKFQIDHGVFVKNAAGDWVNPVDLSGIPNLVITKSFPCTVPASGTATCTPASAISFPIIDIGFGDLLSISLDFSFDITLKINSDGIIVDRSVSLVGSPSSPMTDELTFTGSPAVVADPVVLPCDAAVGNTASYALRNQRRTLHPTMGVGMSLGVNFTYVGITESVGTLWSTTLAEGPLDPVELSADDVETVLGPLGADNVAPVLDGSDFYLGHEGTPIKLSVDASDGCGTPVVTWAFSDGSVAYGPSPYKTFADDGTYTALVTATDSTGNSTTQLVDFAILNVAPKAFAGPDHTAAWGRPVNFGGAGVDPGAADQASLVYSWSFGDGSPSATGGPNAVHTYQQPGDYDATLTVTDKETASGTDTRTIHVRRRTVDVAVTGPSVAVFDTATTLVASVVDEFGDPVPNRSVTFFVDGVAVGSAPTSTNGVASLQHVVGVPAGAHQVTATMATDGRYEGASSTPSALTVGKKGTSMAYTGAVTGAPNKVVSLSATLTDATGTLLAGRTVNFTLGTQSASAVTNANGVATTSLKLSQKNGTYTVSATWTPSGADAARYHGSSTTATFKLQAK